MNEPVFILKGNVVYSKNKDELRILKDHYLISESGLVKGVFEKVPPEYAQVSVSDYGECLIIPGLTDLHVHAPQYTFRAMGMDMELLEWLETNTFPEEAKYQDLEYARRAYRIFTDNLKRSVTTRACIFGIWIATVRIISERNRQKNQGFRQWNGSRMYCIKNIRIPCRF